MRKVSYICDCMVQVAGDNRCSGFKKYASERCVLTQVLLLQARNTHQKRLTMA